ncbi:hypothetical protein J4E91_004271 [Alternaria rosae]|nr:hypothetical protein J4E91_004271 [Alternaria rosae]
MALPASERIVIAETGDVFLTLRNPGAPFAVWEFDTEDDDAAGEINFEEEGNEQEGEEENANREGLRQKKRKMVVRLREGAEDQDMSGDGANPGPMTDDTIQPAHPSLVYQVSSQHLITASPKFKSELTSWSESVKGDDGFYHVNTTDWDPEAFAIMLNVLHLRIRKVSKSLSLELLAKVAMLVDYYRCWEAFDLIADVWIKDLRKKHPVPKTYGRKLMLWMLISWRIYQNDENSIAAEFRAEH